MNVEETKAEWFYEDLQEVLSVQFSSVAQSCPIVCNSKDCSTKGFPVNHQLPGLMHTHVH